MRTQCFQKINENKKFFDEAVIIAVIRRHHAITNHTITCTILIILLFHVLFLVQQHFGFVISMKLLWSGTKLL